MSTAQNPLDINNKPETLYAGIRKDDLKALFYLMAGKPDSNIKLFYDPICIEPNDILELNESIQEKLMNHSVEVATTSIIIHYTSNESEIFGIWAEFTNHKWNTHKEIEAITIKWDFMVNFPQYAIPQRHTLLVKISSRLTPLHLLQAMLSNDSDDLENVENEMAPVVCRVDFINHILSDELIIIVENWIKSRIKPQFNPKISPFLKKHKTGIARILHYSIPIFLTFLVAGILDKIIQNNLVETAIVTIKDLKIFMFWLLGSGIGIFTSLQIGHWIAYRTYQSIEQYGEHCVFNFTNGDKNKHQKIEEKNKKYIVNILINIVSDFSINLIVTLISIFLFKK